MSAMLATTHNFQQQVMESELPVLVDFFAPWCGPCKQISPLVEEIAREKAGKVKVAKVNVEDHPELASQFSIMSLPTLMTVKGGKVVQKTVGARPKQAILRLVESISG